MFCRECRAELYNRRSDLCIACGAVATLALEFKEQWASARLRGIAADVATSACRTIRALRIFGKSPGGGEVSRDLAEGVTIRPAETRKRSRSRSPPKGSEAREERKASPRNKPERKSPVRGGPAGSSGGAGARDQSDSYYSPTSSDFEVKDYTKKKAKGDGPEEERGVTPKVRPAAPARGRSPLQRRSHQSVKARSSSRTRPEKRLSPVPAKVEAGSAEDKERSKAAYLASQKTQVCLREGPKPKEERPLHENLLEVFTDKPEDEGARKKKRRRRSGA